MLAHVYQLFCFLFFALPLFANATVIARTDNGGGINNSCNGGTIQCCNQVTTAQTLISNNPLLFGLGAILANIGLPLTTQLGVGCTAVNVLGLGGNQCTSQATCCTGNTIHGGLITIACNNISL